MKPTRTAGVAKNTLCFFVAVFFATLATSCRTTQTITKEVPVYIHDTLATYTNTTDSVYIERWHTTERQGDTVYITNTQTATRWRTRTDTAYQYTEQPITITQTERVEVERPLTERERFFIHAGGLFISMLVFAALAIAIYLYLRHLKQPK